MPLSARIFFACLLICAGGCALLKTDGGLTSPKESVTLRPEQVDDFENETPVRRVIRLHTSIASAVASDRRIRSLAWEELDESGLMSPEDRSRLNQSGIRVGVAGGSVPWALSSLLRGEQSRRESEANYRATDRTSSMGSNVLIPEGSASVIELPRSPDETLYIPPDEIAGLRSGAELNHARVIIEMKAVEYGDGWAVIHFLPQVHHGSMTARYSVSGCQELMPTRQRIQPLYEQQFQVKVHTGETIVIGYHDSEDWTVGRLMFRTDLLAAEREHLVALQMTSIDEVRGEKSMQVHYQRY